MGSRGPVPKRDDNRAGHRSKSERADKVVATMGAVDAPAPDSTWAPEARDWYLSLARSGQSFYYEPSDWQRHRLTARMIHELVTSSRPSAELFKAVQSAMDAALDTEAARRRNRIEVDRERPTTGSDDAATDDAAAKVAERFAALRVVGDAGNS